MEEKKYISKEKKAELEQELQDLRTVKRKEVLDALEYAKSLGDLSENAEYHQAREDQGKLEERIQKIEEILKESIVAKKPSGENIGMGSVVTVCKKGEKATRVYTIVGGEEVDTASGKISHNSPLGLALIGHKKGDETSFETPGGKNSYVIVDVA